MATWDMRSASHEFPITVGQTVYMTPWGNMARYWGRNGDWSYIPGVVESIGRKYFYVNRNGARYRFQLDGFRSAFDDNAGYVLWESPEVFLAYVHAMLQWDAIRDLVSKVSTQQLNKVGFDFVNDLHAVCVHHGMLQPVIM